jgi:TonB-dependent receptor
MNRNFEEYRYQMITETSLNITHFEGDFDKFLSYDNFGITDTVFDYSVNGGDPNKPRYADGIKKYETGHFYINQVNNKNFYKGQQTIAAGYAMGIFELTKNFKTIVGVRLENTNMEVVSKDVDSIIVKEKNPITGDIISADTIFTQSSIKLLDVLPSLSLIYDITDDIKIRAGFSQTIARPNLRELAPFEQFDTKNGFYLVGNPNLKRTVIQNYDLRLEWYPKAGDMVAISGYYKNFKDPIIRAFNPSATIPELKFENVDKASVIGFEAEVRKKLDFISSIVKDFTVATNFTLINSKTDIRPTEVLNSKSIDSTYAATTRPFVGQSPYIVNAMLMYQNSKIGHESTLSFNVAGAKLYNVALFATPDIYEMPVPMLNFKASQNIGKYLVVSFVARNILNSEIRKTQTHRGTQYTTESFKIGRTIGLGLTFRIK